jgi:type II secretory ATPase GspE/PulE/Tfp pilus assembly ATPase PilB-like protein
MEMSEIKRLMSSNVAVLTAPGGDHFVDPELQKMVCLLSSGELFVSRHHKFRPNVKGFMARLDRMKRPYRVIDVEMEHIGEIYSMGGTATNAISLSNTQSAARDIFHKATAERASDIHIRVSSRTGTEIFYRIHNDLVLKHRDSYEYGTQLCTAIYQSMTDISDVGYDANAKQDARISDRNKIPEGLDGIRVATSPQANGQIMVLRLLYDDASDNPDPVALGYSGEQSDNLLVMRRRPIGINIISGPTGSGKSTTLQRVMTALIQDSKGRKNVITVEDPPEYPITGAVQTPVTNAENEEERSAEFQSSIRAAMRLDPDVIMIGEMRDSPSAQLAFRAAMTGHQVWTTVHANTAWGIIQRLMDMGVPAELVCDPSIVTGLICQRLVKVLCPHCKRSLSDHLNDYDSKDLNRIMSAIKLDAAYVHNPEGCPSCRHTGIAGRTVVAETVLTNEKLMYLIRSGDRAGAIKYWEEGLRGLSMLKHAIVKIDQGLIDPFQAEDVVGPLYTEQIGN